MAIQLPVGFFMNLGGVSVGPVTHFPSMAIWLAVKTPGARKPGKLDHHNQLYQVTDIQLQTATSGNYADINVGSTECCPAGPILLSLPTVPINLTGCVATFNIDGSFGKMRDPNAVVPAPVTFAVYSRGNIPGDPVLKCDRGTRLQ